MPGPEAKGERAFREYVVKKGGICIKLGGARGIPDRLVLGPGNLHYFTEFKSMTGRLSKAQQQWRAKLKFMGHTCKVHHSASEAIAFYEQEVEAASVPTEGS